MNPATMDQPPQDGMTEAQQKLHAELMEAYHSELYERIKQAAMSDGKLGAHVISGGEMYPEMKEHVDALEKEVWENFKARHFADLAAEQNVQ